MDLRLEGKVAIVTGGARGVGAAITVGFVREGARSSLLTSSLILPKSLRNP